MNSMHLVYLENNELFYKTNTPFEISCAISRLLETLVNYVLCNIYELRSAISPRLDQQSYNLLYSTTSNIF